MTSIIDDSHQHQQPWVSYKFRQIVKPENATTAQTYAWDKMDQKACADLIMSITPSELRHIKNCTSKSVWERLKEIFRSKVSRAKSDAPQAIAVF